MNGIVSVWLRGLGGVALVLLAWSAVPARAQASGTSFQALAGAARTMGAPPRALTSSTRLRTPTGAAPGTRRIRYRYGPIAITPGANWINLGAITKRQKPDRDGFITRIRPDMVLDDGTVPPSNVVMFHHGVWLNASRPDATSPGLPERFFAAGEEKTILTLPKGYGYPVRARDRWLMNDMIHNLTSQRMRVYITYDLDFIPADSATGRRTKPVTPLWMDVENGSSYPVFDVKRGAGSGGRFTYPTQASRPYGDGPAENVWTADRSGTLVATSGHLHSGGLWTDMSIARDRGRPVRIFRSRARYFEPAGPVSWDVSMTATRPDWRVRVRRGDRLSITATYETERASWYESMGIMVAYLAAGTAGPDPFTEAERIDTTGAITHGHLHENDEHGGGKAVYPDARKLRGTPFDALTLDVDAFRYGAGDLGRGTSIPVVRPGQPLTFRNLEGDTTKRAYHTITSCAAPCAGAAGIAYPLADGKVDFDSGQLGFGPPGFTAAVNRDTWSTPPDLPNGTYTYFCRIHPFMRGAFRVEQ
jgi:hypothetical protein